MNTRLSSSPVLLLWLLLLLGSDLGAPALLAQGPATLKKAAETPVVRRALLIAAQEGHPDMQAPEAPFPALKYPTRDVVLLYAALKDPLAGRFDHVTVVASGQQLERLRLDEAQRLQGSQSPDERLDSERVLKAIRDIRDDDDTFPDTLRDWSKLAQDTSLPAAERLSKEKARRLQCGQVEGKSQQPLLFPCSKDVLDAVQEFKKDTAETDEALVYFSGHGFRTSPFRRGFLNVGSRMLVVADSYVDRGQKHEPAYFTLSVGGLLESLMDDVTRQKLVILAACAASISSPSDAQPAGSGGKKEAPYAPLIVRLVNTKSGGPRTIGQDGSLKRLEILGAAQEEALESLKAPILGDVMTFYLRTLIEDRLSRLELKSVDLKRLAASLDWDADGAITGAEGFYFIEKALSGQGQVPYFLRADDVGTSFVLRGRSSARQPPAMVFPGVVNLGLTRKKSAQAGEEPTESWAEVHMDGKVLTVPQSLDARLHTFELVSDEGSVVDKVRYAPAQGQQVRWEELFFQLRGELSLASGVSTLLGPPAFPEGGSQLWSSAGLSIGLHRTHLFLQGDGQKLEVGGLLTMASSRPALAGNLLTTQHQVALSVGGRLNQRLTLPTAPRLRLGVYPGLSYLSLFEYRKTMLVAHVLGSAELSWSMGRTQQLGVGLSLRGMVADLDCQTDNSVTAEGYTLEQLLQTRCQETTDATGQVTYVEKPGLYVEPLATVQWSWLF